MKSRKPLELCMGILLIAGALALSREVVQVISKNQRAAKTIVVDAGHGGSDPGMVTGERSESGHCENVENPFGKRRVLCGDDTDRGYRSVSGGFQE